MISATIERVLVIWPLLDSTRSSIVRLTVVGVVELKCQWPYMRVPKGQGS
jgi:hypothetical protein